MFLERALQLTRRGGRIGLVLPSGVTSDHGSAGLRRLLFSQSDVDAIVGFDNRAGVFAIHRSIRFVLLTATSGRPTREIACRLGERNPAALESGGSENDDAWYPVRITPALLERLTGSELALPELTAPIDLTIAERAAALFRPLGDQSGWAAHFGRELNATDDRGHFLPAGRGLPVIEGKHLEPFSVDTAAARWSISAEGRGAPARDEASPLAARLPRRRERDEPDDSHRGCAAAGDRNDAHRVLSAFAAFTHRPALPLRPVQQLRRQLPGSAARRHARHDGDRGAAADPDAR